MAVAFTARTTIDRPAAAVWGALVDWDQAHRWMDGVDSLRAEGATEVGTRLTFRSRGKDRASTIADLQPGRSVRLRSEQGGVTADYLYRLDPVDDQRTRVELVADCSTGGAWRLVGPLLRALLRRADGNQLDNLKRIVETQT